MHIVGSYFFRKGDIDIICEREDVPVSAKQIRETFVDGATEYTTYDFLNNRRVCEQYDSGTDGPFRKISLAGYVLMKRSHLHRPVNFQKHIRDYHAFLPKIVRDETYYDILNERIKLTKQVFGDKTPSLMKSNEEFFDDYVKKHYVHDDIHKAVAHTTPIYEKLKRDKSLAYCEKDLWNNLSHEDKVNCVREECFVIALERKIIPAALNKDIYSKIQSFDYALERVCTTLCGGYFRDFAIENWPEIRNHGVDFVQRFKDYFKGESCL